MVPWVLLQPAALWAFLRRRNAEPWRLFLKIALISMLVALTLSASRTETYYRPAIFVLCLMTGEYIRSAYESAGSSSARRVIAGNWLLVALFLVLLPLVAAHALLTPQLAWLAAPSAAAFTAAWFLSRGRWTLHATAFAWGLLCAVVTVGNFAALIRPIDAVIAWRSFFDAIQSSVDGARSLSTTIVDDNRLPAINFYLDRRIDVVALDRVSALLSSADDVGVIVSAMEYDLLQPALAAIPHREVRAPHGLDRYVYLGSAPAAADNSSAPQAESALSRARVPPSTVEGRVSDSAHGFDRSRSRRGGPRKP
jgi:hypothetical protein